MSRHGCWQVGGVPFFIESAINVYIDLKRELGAVGRGDLPRPQGMVAKLLDHRRAPQRALVTALASVQIFDRNLYQQTAYVLSVELGILHFRDFVDSFLVESRSGELYKTHDLLTESVRSSAADEHIRMVSLEAATAHLLERCRGRGERNTRPFSRSSTEYWLAGDQSRKCRAIRLRR